MKILKGIVLSFFAFLLFLSLTVLGFSFMVNRTILNPGFVTAEINRLDFPSLVEDMVSQQKDIPQDLKTSLLKTIPDIEPQIKQQADAAVYSIYDYLLGKKEKPELAATLRSTLLKTDNLVALVDKLDLSAFAKEFIRTQSSQQFPPQVKQYLIDSMDKTIADLKPWIKQQVTAVADPMLDYLLGKRDTFSVSVPLGPVKEAFRVNVKEAFLKSPPPEVAGVPPAMLGQLFDMFYQQFSATMPATFVVDQSMLGNNDARNQIAGQIAEAERNLEQAKRFVSYSQLIFQILIGLSLLLSLCIVLIYREIKGSARRLGTTFFTYGVMEYAGIFVGKYIIGKQLPLAETPQVLQNWLPQFIDHLFAPLAAFSLGCAIGGLVLIIVSFVYKPRQIG